MKKFLLLAAAALATSSAFAAEKVLVETDFSKMSEYNMWKGSAGEFQIKDGALEVTNAVATENFWDLQYFVADNLTLTGGTEYTIDVKIKGFSGTLHYNLGTWSENVMGGPSVAEAADWQNVVVKATAKADAAGNAHLILQSGDFVGSYSIASVKITYNDEGGETPVEPADPNIIAKLYPGSATLIGWGDQYAGEAVTEDGREAFKITHAGESANPWDAQFAFDAAYEAGTTYYITMDVKGDPGSIPSGFQQTEGYKGCGDCNNFEITSEWNSVMVKGTAITSENGDPNRWVASVGKYVGTFYISNMVISANAPVSAVDSIATVAAPAGVYNLNGVKVADELNTNLPKGLYIVNGKKVVR